MTKVKLRVLMGENIRNERMARGMSIDNLAEMLELTSGFVGLIERGRRGATAYTLYKLSQIFGISVDNIFARASEKQMRFAEETEPRNAEARRRKITTLSEGLTNAELDFVINTIKGIKAMNHTHPYTETDEAVKEEQEYEEEDFEQDEDEDGDDEE